MLKPGHFRSLRQSPRDFHVRNCVPPSFRRRPHQTSTQSLWWRGASPFGALIELGENMRIKKPTSCGQAVSPSSRETSEAYAIFASNFLADARRIAAGGLHSFNASSWTDTGSFSQTVTLATDEPRPHLASGLHSTAYFALGHAIELFLKSFLLRKGSSEKILKDELGHDLRKAMALAEKHGLRFGYANEIAKFSEYHRRLLFRYPQEPLVSVPPVEDLISLATELERLVRCPETRSS